MTVTTPLSGTVVTSYDYDSADRLITVTRAGVPTSYTWSDRGELLTDGAQSYQWDAAGRLVGVSGPGGLDVVYSYNGAGDRVAMVMNGVETTYVVDPFGLVDGVSQVLLEEAAGAARRYLYGLDLFAQQAGATTYLAYDALSVRLHTDAGGQVTAQYRYAPFGEVVGAGPAGYGFTGERWDGSTNLLYLRARYYRPELGRFVSRDPFRGKISTPWSLHAYAYVGNNAVNGKDATGLCPSLHLEPTACEQFAREVDEIIQTARAIMESKTFLGIPVWSNRDIEWVTVQFLGEYYAGIKQISFGAGVVNPLPRTKGLTVPVPRFDRYRRDAYPATEEGDKMYGFQRDYFDNTHHYMAQVYYGYAVGEQITADVLSPWLELWNAFDEKRLPSRQCAPGPDHGPQAWFYMLSPKDCRWVVTRGQALWFGPGGTLSDLRIAEVAAQHGALVRQRGVAVLPSLIRRDLCKQLYYYPE